MAAPRVAGTGLVGSAVAMATQYSAPATEARRASAGAVAQAGKKTVTVSVSLVLSVFKGEKGLGGVEQAQRSRRLSKGAVWGKKRELGREFGSLWGRKPG